MLYLGKDNLFESNEYNLIDLSLLIVETEFLKCELFISKSNKLNLTSIIKLPSSFLNFLMAGLAVFFNLSYRLIQTSQSLDL